MIFNANLSIVVVVLIIFDYDKNMQNAFIACVMFTQVFAVLDFVVWLYLATALSEFCIEGFFTKINLKTKNERSSKRILASEKLEVSLAHVSSDEPACLVCLISSINSRGYC